jgi:hypothetical protein
LPLPVTFPFMQSLAPKKAVSLSLRAASGAVVSGLSLAKIPMGVFLLHAELN